jgi:predicted TPR repeat methyltransferase
LALGYVIENNFQFPISKSQEPIKEEATVGRDFAQYDARKYPTADVIVGYARWAPLYDKMVPGRIDFPMLAKASTIDWSSVKLAVDLACGTGRIGGWLKKEKSIPRIDGVDVSLDMLALAEPKKIYERLVKADVSGTGLNANVYDLAISALAACHMENLSDLYREAARLVKPKGFFILIDYHQYFLLNGIPTHFPMPSGEIQAIKNYVHLFSDHFNAAKSNGWELVETEERVIDKEWAAVNPAFAKHQEKPVGFMLVFTKR